MTKEKMDEIRTKFASAVKCSNISDDSALKELGLDSLDIVEMCLDFEDAYGIKFSNEELQGISTVGDLMKLIESK